MTEDIKKVKGVITIIHEVDCPHCGADLSESNLPKWFRKNVSDGLPDDELYQEDYDVKCPICNKDFIINGFIY